MNRGMTLAELAVVLALTGILTSLAAPRLLGGADRWIVREAREELVSLFYLARLEARRHGEATVRVTTGQGAELASAGRDVPLLWRPSVEGLEVRVEGTRDVAELTFGPAGVGRFANATLTVTRGRAQASIVISSYGRIRR
jgi:prepilin-type N-terminal cleavage/methylation domain-containing protein